MAKDLTISAIERQNVLNNSLAIPRIQSALDIEAYHFEGKYYLTKQMVADFYEVDVRTIERYLETNKEELERNGYFLCRGKRLKEFKLQFAPDINVGHKTVSLSLFDFRAFLNIGMLLAESEKAKRIRSLILDIVISTINEKAGGGKKKVTLQRIMKSTVIPRAFLKKDTPQTDSSFTLHFSISTSNVRAVLKKLSSMSFRYSSKSGTCEMNRKCFLICTATSSESVMP